MLMIIDSPELEVHCCRAADPTFAEVSVVFTVHTQMELKLLLITVLMMVSLSATAAADYIRPQPRKTFHLPWHSKPSSYPQQVTLFISSLYRFFFNRQTLIVCLLSGESTHNFSPFLSFLNQPYISSLSRVLQ